MLIGRADELEACLRSIDDARPVVLRADAGMGKTALLTEAIDACRRPAFMGGGLVTLSWKAYLPLETALRAPLRRGDHAAVARATAGEVGDGVLVIDDMQWADDDTLRVLALLAGRVRMAAAVRADDPDAARVTEALEVSGFGPIALLPLTVDESEALLGARRPELGRAAVRDVVARAGGNPLLLEQLSWGGAPSSSLQISMEARLERLPQGARATLGVLSLLGRPADRGMAGPGIDDLIAAGLVIGTAGGFTPRHSLLAEAAAERLGDDERREIHASIAAASSEPGEAAVHLDLAGDRDAARKSALRAVAATEHAGQRARLFKIALRNGDDGPGDDGIRSLAAEALVESGEYREAERIAAEIRSDDPAVTAEALLYRARAARGMTGLAAGRDFVQRGLRAVSGSGSSIEVRLLIEEARIANWEWRPESAIPTARRALGLAKGTDDLAEAMLVMGAALSTEGARDAVVYLRLATERARREGKMAIAFDAAFQLVTAMKLTKEWRGSLPIAEAYRRDAISAGLRTWDVMFRWHEMAVALDCSGDLERVIEIGEGMLADIAIPARLVGDTIGSVAVAHLERGRIDACRETLTRAAPRSEQESIYPYVAWADLHLADGDMSAAIEVVVEARDRFPEDPNLMFLWVIKGWAELQLGREPSPYRGPVFDPVGGYLEAMRGQIELARGHATDAERAFVAAAETIHDLDIRAELRCRWAAGVAAGRAGDVERARGHLLEVERTATELGFAHVLGKVHASLRSVGVRRSAVRAKGIANLTGRERDVLRLVAAGLRTRAIAARLGIERATVDDIVRSAKSKLNARTRIEAAGRLAELERDDQDPQGAVAS